MDPGLVQRDHKEWQAIYKVVKFAADVTAAKEQAIEDAGKLAALSKSQAVIEFTPLGDIISANENFCKNARL